MFTPPRQFSNVKRFSEICWTIADYEMSYFLEHLGLKEKDLDRLSERPDPERVRAVLEDLGGAFIKLGQVLSLRPDLIPQRYCDAFAELQDNVPPFDTDEAAQIVNDEVDTESFILTPLASASVSQVHKAIVDGEACAVKVRRPDVEDRMTQDIEIMAYFAKRIKDHFNPDLFDPVEIVSEFKDYTMKELDFRYEARHLRVARRNFKDNDVIVPEVKHVTPDVLVMEYIDGTTCKELIGDRHHDVAFKLCNAFFQQVFEDGFFHADPHPSNVMVKDGSIALLDYGIVGRLDDRTKRLLSKLFISLMTRDVAHAIEGLQGMDVIPRDVSMTELRDDLGVTLGPYYDVPLQEVEVGALLRDLFQLAKTYGIRLPRNLVVLGKAVVTLEGTCVALDPSFNIVEAARPYVMDHADTDAIARRVKQGVGDMARFASDVPRMGKRAFEVIEDADEELHRIDDDIQTMTQAVGTASLRVTTGLLVSSVIVGYALMHGFGQESMFGYANLPFALFVSLGIVVLAFVLHYLEHRVGWKA